jgi:hypothetical protein
MTRKESRDIYVGRTSDGGRFYLDIGYSGTHPVLVSGTHIPYRSRNADNVGQCVYRVLDIAKPENGWTVEELAEVHRIWDKYQLEKDVPEADAAKIREWVNRR